MPVTTTTTLASQFQTFFDKKLLDMVKQETVLTQFAVQSKIPKNVGGKEIASFRFGAPSLAGVQSLSEGTAPTVASYRALSLNQIKKALAQYGEVIAVTDISRATELFNSLKQSSDTIASDIALWIDSVTRNVLVGSNMGTAAGGTILGIGVESPTDNNDAINTAAASGGIKVYGNPATLTSQTFGGLNNDLTAANTVCSSTVILDLMTKLRRNRAPMINGKYVYVTDPRVSRDLMNDTNWLNASNYGNRGEPFYKGEVGEIYGCKVVVQTNSFVSTGSTTAADEFVFQTTSNGGGVAASRDIIASFMLGGQAFAVPTLEGDSVTAPRITIVDTPDKSDPLNQLVTVGVKSYFQALRLAAGNTASTGNPVWYLVHRCKTSTLL